MAFRLDRKSNAIVLPPTQGNTAIWNSSNTNIFYNNGNVGINNSNPSNAVDVGGSVNIVARTTDLSNGTSYMIKPYYNVNGSPINNLFYPAIPDFVSNRAVSNWVNRNQPLEGQNLNQVAWSPDLGLFAVVSQQGLQGRMLFSPDGINWNLGTSGITLSNVTNRVITECRNDVSNTIICSTTSGLFPGINVDLSGSTVNLSDISITNIVDISRFSTSSFIDVSTASRVLWTNSYSCTDTSGLLPGFLVASYINNAPGLRTNINCETVYDASRFQLTRSSDSGGTLWTGNTCFADRQYLGCIWCRDLSGTGYFIGSGYTAANQQIVTSTNGRTWINRNTPTGLNDLGVFSYSPLRRRVICSFGSLQASTAFIYSDDAINWLAVPNPVPTNHYFASIWSPELNIFCAVAVAGTDPRQVLTSLDGINWTPRIAPVNSWRAISWSPQLGIFCAIANAGPANVMTSPDGINWTTYSTPNSLDYRTLVWSPELKVFVAFSRTGTNRLAFSYDGKVWSERALPSNNQYRWIEWSPELGIFCGTSITGLQNDSIITSTLKARPPNPSNVFDSSFNNINQNYLWNFQSFGRNVPVLKTGSSAITVNPGENWVICNTSADVSCNLPLASLYPGLEITLKNVNNFRIDATVISRTTNTPVGTLLANTAGRWATIVSNGSNWVIENGN